MATKFEYFGISKVGEGAEKTEEQVPIVIPYNKLLEWLLDRKLVQKTWSGQAAALKKQARELASTLPMDVRNSGSSEEQATEWDYVSVVDTVGALMKRPGQDLSKGLFGGYNDATLHAWSGLVSAYEKNWCHLAECAQTLLQLVKYDLPNQRRLVERIQRQLLDLEKREAVLLEESASLARQYERNCAQLGISSAPNANITAELEALVQQLPVHFAGVVQAVQAPPVRRALEYYGAFRGYTTAIARGTNGWSVPRGLCPALTFVVQHGNTSHWALEQALHPEQWAGITVDAPSASSSTTGGDDVQTAAPVIDWNADTADDDAGAASGDWQIEVEGGGNGAAADSDVPVVVDWVEMETAAPVVGTTKADKARALASESILGALASRGAFLDDLHELRSFLDGRLREKIGAGGVLSSVADAITSSTDCPDALRSADSTEVLQVLRAGVDGALAKCEAPALVQLLEIQASKRYVARLAASVRKKMEMSQQMRAQAEEVQWKRGELQRELAQVRPRLKSLGDRSLRIQKELVEPQLTKHFKGRVVQLAGEINNLA